MTLPPDEEADSIEGLGTLHHSSFIPILILVTNKNAFQSKAHLPLADRKSNTYNLTLE